VEYVVEPGEVWVCHGLSVLDIHVHLEARVIQAVPTVVDLYDGEGGLVPIGVEMVHERPQIC